MGSSTMVLDPKPSPEPPTFLPSVKSNYIQGSDEAAGNEEDLYSRLKPLQRQLEFIDIEEKYAKDEQKNLKHKFLYAQEEVNRIQSVLLVIGQFMEMVDQSNDIVGSTTISNYYVRILSTINRELLKPSTFVSSRMVCDVFRLAKENAPTIIFIDEVDAIATASLMLKLELIEKFAQMNLSDEVDLEDYVSQPDKISSAEPSEQNTYADIEAVYKCLQEKYGAKEEDIVLYGQSV
ncbi:hypothetical protein Fmac_008326 [Flemingia macrophylla]|uniref:ATPase AAA-type core domain-containing protein n=1 Tax=Flemingia macrophylla TaxID=520843 RepID=A0ABD1MX41_9FABA